MTRTLALTTVFVTIAFSSHASEPSAAKLESGPISRPEPRAQTPASGTLGDSFDDPAIWVHPTDSAKSLVLGTNKKGGLHLFDLTGKQLGVVSPTVCPNNVDILPGFPLRMKRTDLALAACREKGKECVRVWAIDPDTRTLTDVSVPGGISVFGGGIPYGTCTYHSPKTGKWYFFVNHKSGKYEQYVLGYTAEGRIDAAKVREFSVSSVAEGCVADPVTGALYVSEEDVGLWRFSAEEDGGTEGKLIAKVGEHGIKDDCEGVTLYEGEGGKGYLILSSQGNNTFKVFEREGDNRFVGSIIPAAGKFGTVSETDGISVTSRSLGSAYPHGLFVVQDGTRREEGQRFKYYGWEDIAAGLKQPESVRTTR